MSNAQQNNSVSTLDFEYNGKKYEIQVIFKNHNDVPILTLDPQKIKQMEFTNNAEVLFKRGFIIYEEIMGTTRAGSSLLVSELQDKTCVVTIKDETLQRDGDANGTTPVNTVNWEFVVENVREDQTQNDASNRRINYIIQLAGIEKNKLNKHVNFENWSGTQGAPDTCFNIIQRIISDCGLEMDIKTIENANDNMTIFRTTQNATALETIFSLLNKNFFTTQPGSDNHQGVTFFYYDALENKYKCQRMPNDGSNIRHHEIMLKYDGVDDQALSQTDRNTISTCSIVKQSEVVGEICDLVLYTYDIRTNGITSKTLKLIQLMQGIGLQMPQIRNSGIKKYISEWNCPENLYDMVSRFLLGWDAPVINTQADLSRKLFDALLIETDQRIELASEDNTEEAQQVLEQYKNLNDAWFISGLTLIVKPQEKVVKQNIRLIRAPKPIKANNATGS